MNAVRQEHKHEYLASLFSPVEAEVTRLRLHVSLYLGWCEQ